MTRAQAEAQAQAQAEQHQPRIITSLGRVLKYQWPNPDGTIRKWYILNNLSECYDFKGEGVEITFAQKEIMNQLFGKGTWQIASRTHYSFDDHPQSYCGYVHVDLTVR